LHYVHKSGSIKEEDKLKKKREGAQQEKEQSIEGEQNI
jgi:hypothetical protein